MAEQNHQALPQMTLEFQESVGSILDTVGRLRAETVNTAAIEIISLEALNNHLSEEEQAVITTIYNLDPASLGFSGPYVGLEAVPDDVVLMPAQPYLEFGHEPATKPAQYIPRVPYEAFQNLSRAMQQDIGKSLLLESGYRSEAFQAITFLSFLKQSNFDLQVAAKRVAIPGYSEHSMPSSLALDFWPMDGELSDEHPTDFQYTAEYHWLTEHAGEYNFYLSYPEDNPHGIMFEPWHWRHIPARA